MTRNIVWTVILCVIAGILQSTVIAKFAIFNVIPDLALCILVFSAYVNGTMTGQVSGFFSGLLLDFLSGTPPMLRLGFSSLIRTIIGAVTGLFKGAFFLDIFFMPVILCALSTLAKILITLILHLIMGFNVPNNYFTYTVWVELGLNCLSAPLLFLLLKRFKPILAGRS